MIYLRSYNEHVRTEMRLQGLPVEPEFEESIINQTTLSDLYGSDVPGDDELIWQYVNTAEYSDDIFDIKDMDIEKAFSMLRDSIEHISPENLDIINNYKDNIEDIKDDVIVIDSISNNIVDGYHRLLALKESGVPTIKVIDLSD